MLSDHLAKAYIGILNSNVASTYDKRISHTQFGATSGGGTDIPAHIVQSAIEYAHHFGLSIFVMFLDLEKAFDRVIRELVFGYPHNLALDEKSRLDY